MNNANDGSSESEFFYKNKLLFERISVILYILNLQQINGRYRDMIRETL